MIIRYITIFFIGLVIFGCSNLETSENTIIISTDSINLVLIDTFYVDTVGVTSVYNEVEATKVEVIIKNESDYSKPFIKGLYEIGYETFELIDSILLINDIDTVYFPETPKMGKRMVLTGKVENLVIALTVKRINYTTIEYRIEMVEFGNSNHFEIGTADISSGFFFGSETDVSDKTGLGYLSTEFVAFNDDDCYTYIRLGFEEETGPFLLGKLKKNCNGKISEITLDNFVTLVEK